MKTIYQIEVVGKSDDAKCVDALGQLMDFFPQANRPAVAAWFARAYGEQQAAPEPYKEVFAEVGNVVSDGTKKCVVLQASYLKKGQWICAQYPHEDGDYSYLCNHPHCRCHS